MLGTWPAHATRVVSGCVRQNKECFAYSSNYQSIIPAYRRLPVPPAIWRSHFAILWHAASHQLAQLGDKQTASQQGTASSVGSVPTRQPSMEPVAGGQPYNQPARQLAASQTATMLVSVSQCASQRADSFGQPAIQSVSQVVSQLASQPARQPTS